MSQTKKRIKNCLEAGAVAKRCREDDENLDGEVLFPKGRPGLDHEILNGYHKHGISDATIRAMDFLSGNGSMHRVRVRYKPREAMAYFVQSEHLDENDGSRRKSKSGWLVPGLERGVFYVPEEKFSKFFEFIEDEGKIVA